MKSLRDYSILVALLGVTALAAIAGGLASAGSREFYAQLQKPSWAPPGWLFGPVWTLLYVMMAIAAWLVYLTRGPSGSRPLLTLYIIQLVVNALWTWIFFAWRMGAVALAEIILLWCLVGLTTVTFWKVRKAAGVLLVPYWLWVSFATALTFAVWRLNPTQL